MVHLRLVHSLPKAPAHGCTVDLASGATRVTAGLLDAARWVPRQPEVVRARAIVRARAAIATEVVFAAAPAIRSPGLTVSVTMIACAAFAIGAAGATAALRVRQQPRPAALWAAASTPPPALAEIGSARSSPTTSVAPGPAGGRKLTLRSATATVTAKHRGYAAELECLQRAQVAFAGRDFTGALAASAEHARRFPGSWLAEEREALRVRSLGGAGHHDEARRAAIAFGHRFPRSALLSRLRDTTGAD